MKKKIEINEYYRVYREKNGTDINSIAFLKDRFQIKHGERYSKLEISETDVDDAGKYTCKLGSESSADIDVIGTYKIIAQIILLYYEFRFNRIC